MKFLNTGRKRENATRLLWHPSFKPNQKFTRSQSFKRTLSRVGKANPRFHRSTKVWKFKQMNNKLERDLVDLCEMFKGNSLKALILELLRNILPTFRLLKEM